MQLDTFRVVLRMVGNIPSSPFTAYERLSRSRYEVQVAVILGFYVTMVRCRMRPRVR